MNAETPTFDLAECTAFIAHWCAQTNSPHLTLTAITPDGPTTTATFDPADTDQAGSWIARQQTAGRNIYFEVNETPARCTKKPTKAMMQAALCRHADVDPHEDDDHPYLVERDRLHKLAAVLHADPVMPPTALLDSGNGIQPLWAVTRQKLCPEAIEIIEAENRAIEAAVGASGTHNIDRLLRLPGTLNYPNAAKQRIGRGVTRARLVYRTDATYTQEQAASLGAHLHSLLADTGLVRLPADAEAEPKPAKKKRSSKRDRIDRSALALGKGAACRRRGMSFDQMVQTLRDDPELADWVHDKGDANDQRELHRIWDKAGETEDAVARVVAEFNAKYMVVNENGKALIYAPTYDAILRRRYHNRMGVPDLKLLYQNRTVEVGVTEEGNAIRAPVANVWLRHEDRKQYIGGIIFDPSGAPTPPDTLNLWQGFPVIPQPGSWKKLRAHVRDVICRGNLEQDDYLIKWFARMVQFPAAQGEVAVVLRGIEGTGKGSLARVMIRILGQHALHISNAKHLVGNFNAHLRDCVFLFADEAFFAGDKAHIGVLNALITEPSLTIEGKYMTTVPYPNFLHVMMASNADWVVPASLDARRYFVLEVGDTHRDDHPYFAAIWEEMEAGGYAAMLHDLLAMDLTDFNVRSVPITDGLQQQKKLSLDTSNAWWLDVLYRGYVFRSKLGLEDFFGKWHDVVATELLYASYREFAKERREWHPLSRETFGKFMVSLGHDQNRASKLAVGERIADVTNAYGGTSRAAERVIHPRPTAYQVRTLADARAVFAAFIRLPIEWPLDDDQDPFP